MVHDREFAWTGELPQDGSFVGYVNVKIEDDGVVFTVRSEGSRTPQSYKIPHAPAQVMIGRLSDSMLVHAGHHAPQKG